MKNVGEKAVELMKKAGFSDAEARVTSSHLTEMQIDAGEIALMRTTQNTALHLRGILGGRYATIRVNQILGSGIEDAVNRAHDSALVAPVDTARQLVDGGGARKFSHGPIEPDREVMHKRIETFCHTIEKDLPQVKMEQAALSHTQATMWVVNSKGLDFEETHGAYNFGAMFSGKRGAKASSFNYCGTKSNDLKRELLDLGLGRELMESSVKEIDHEPFQGKFTGPLVLSPMVFHSFIGNIFEHLGDGRLISKTSVLQEKMNQTICSADLSVQIKTQDKELADYEFTTTDGYLSEPSTIIEAGVLKSWMLSDYGARKTGLTRALNSGSQVVVTGGTKTRAELVSGIDRGLYVGRFSGGYPSANGDFSGTAKNSYLIEGGKITKPLAEVMIAGNLFTMLNAVRGLSSERLNDGLTFVPWAVVDGVMISGV